MVAEEWYVATKVDDNIKYSNKRFNNKVRKVLKHPKGWEYVFKQSPYHKKITFKFVPWNTIHNIDSKRKITIRLSSNKTVEKICGLANKLSCCNMQTKECWLNFYRWINGANPSQLPLYKYRNYMINHEVGHALGRFHTTCPCVGCTAPIMMQHTVSIGECTPNDKPLIDE